MDAIILAGGTGIRLRPQTENIPKPLISIHNISVLERLIWGLKNHGVLKITIAINYLGEMIKQQIGNGDKFDIDIEYSQENVSLGTAGPIKLVKNLPETFFIINSDIITDIHFRNVFKQHISSNSDLTIVTYQQEKKIDFGVLTIQENFVRDYIEKPNYTFFVNTGVLVMNKKVVNLIPENTLYNIDTLIKNLLLNKYIINSFIHKGNWIDIGTTNNLEEALNCKWIPKKVI